MRERRAKGRDRDGGGGHACMGQGETENAAISRRAPPPQRQVTAYVACTAWVSHAWMSHAWMIGSWPTGVTNTVRRTDRHSTQHAVTSKDFWVLWLPPAPLPGYCINATVEQPYAEVHVCAFFGFWVVTEDRALDDSQSWMIQHSIGAGAETVS